MAKHKMVIALLSNKCGLMKELEQITEVMSVQQVDELAHSVEKRAEIIDNLKSIDLDLQAVCTNDIALLSAINHTNSRDALSEDLQEVYDLSFMIKSSAHRISNNDEHIREHMMYEKNRVMKNIESLNKSGTSYAGRYHKSVQTGVGNRFPTKKGKLV